MSFGPRTHCTISASLLTCSGRPERHSSVSSNEYLLCVRFTRLAASSLRLATFMAACHWAAFDTEFVQGGLTKDGTWPQGWIDDSV